MPETNDEAAKAALKRDHDVKDQGNLTEKQESRDSNAGEAAPPQSAKPSEDRDESPAEEDKETEKMSKKEKLKQMEKNPIGGHDTTPVPEADPGYTLKITFHKATNLPIADIESLSSDPFLLATLVTGIPTRHKEDPVLQFRSKTIHKSCDPEFNATWILAHVPSSGFHLKIRVYDEDYMDHDDRLGNVHVKVGNIDKDWAGIDNHEYTIKKRSGSWRAYMIRGCAVGLSANHSLSGSLFMSVENLGPTEGKGGRVYTMGPCFWSQHFSPLLGRMTGTKEPGDDKAKNQKYNFQASQMQFKGPVPAELYHRYVEFKPFVKGMFSSRGLRGRILNRALHHQHMRIYNYDNTTEYGSFPEPGDAMTKKFLELVHYDKGARIFTYILTLDGLLRFTETGKEFSIDLLSKHTMHSDVSVYIAVSGEFFVRRLKRADKGPEDPEQETHPPKELPDGPPKDNPSTNPADYELVVDNDSGTYRPNKDVLPIFEDYLRENLPGMKVLARASDDDEHQDAKKQQREAKKKEGKGMTFAQVNASESSLSSIESEANYQNEKGRHKLASDAKHAASNPRHAVNAWLEGDGILGRKKKDEKEESVAGSRPNTSSNKAEKSEEAADAVNPGKDSVVNGTSKAEKSSEAAKPEAKGEESKAGTEAPVNGHAKELGDATNGTHASTNEVPGVKKE